MKFAEALEVIPSILAETAGMDPIDSIVKLRALHSEGKYTYGVNVLEGIIDDMAKTGVLDPANVKLQAIRAATEAAIMILRIDDIISAAPSKPEKEKREGKEEGTGTEY